MDSTSLDDSLLERMRLDWDKRARRNARRFIATGNFRWNREDFYQSGRLCVFHEVLTDLSNVCQEQDPKLMKVLEIGCGNGRMTGSDLQLRA